MDAGALEFPDAQFDVALAPYVMSVVPHPERVLSETWRVVRPGGQMIVMNHFAAERGPRALCRSGDGEGLRLARLASEVPLFRDRRLDRRSKPTRSWWNGANSAAAAVHAAEGAQGGALIRPAPGDEIRRWAPAHSMIGVGLEDDMRQPGMFRDFRGT